MSLFDKDTRIFRCCFICLFMLRIVLIIENKMKAIHSLQNPYEEAVEVIEVQKGNPLIEEDIIRYEDMYGRV